MKKRLLAAAAALGLGFTLVSSASADTTPSLPYSNTVGVYINSIYGDTSGSINCFTEGANMKTGPEGDATLFMVNRRPHQIWCVITIKKDPTL